MQSWPKQSEADSFYGNPRGRGGKASPTWQAANLVKVSSPFALHFAGSAVRSFLIHAKCADSLKRVFAAIWIAAGESQAKIDQWGVSTFGGTYNFRLKRNSNTLSMHAYGCAIDLAPDRFPMGRAEPGFVPEVLKAFADEAWVNLTHDRMHFQAALI